MNKPRIETKCWECGELVRITRKELAQVGDYPKCLKHEAQFLAWVSKLRYEQN